MIIFALFFPLLLFHTHLFYLPELLVNATVYQDSKGQGEGAIDLALKLIKKEKLDKNETFIPFKLVTIENVNDFLKK